MKTRLSLAAALLLVCSTAFAQHEHGKKDGPPMDPAMMEAMMKAAMPGPAHKALDSMVGTWNTKITMWPMPGADPMTTEGVSEMKWVMGGRYVEQRFTGSFMGAPFEGLGYTGYDNIKKRYFSTWMDNMSTSMMMSTGNAGADGTMTMTGTMTDPMTGKDSETKEKFRVVDANNAVFEMWTPALDGKMFKMMEIAYTRKK